MLTKIKKLCFLMIFLGIAALLTGCSSPLDKAIKNVILNNTVTEDFALPEVDYQDAKTIWTVKTGNAIKIKDNYAEVVRPGLDDAQVVLEMTVQVGDITKTKTYTVTVPKARVPETIRLNFSRIEGTFTEDPRNPGIYLLVAGASVQIDVEAGEEESTEVNWESSDSSKLTVEDGLLTGKVISGKIITVTATAVAPNLEGEFAKQELKIQVVSPDAFDPQGALIRTRSEILENMPEYVSENVTFPFPSNSEIDIQYIDKATDTVLDDGKYTYVWAAGTVDHKEVFDCQLSYLDETLLIQGITVKVVKDLQNNDFKYIEEAKDLIRKQLAGYLESGAAQKLVHEDMSFPTEYISGDTAKEDGSNVVEMSYSSSAPLSINPASFGEPDEETKTVLLHYTKPNDDTEVSVAIYLAAMNNGDTMKFKIKTLGCTEEEIVQYIKANVLPQPDENGNYELVGRNLHLETDDPTKRFKINIVWESSDESVLSPKGKFANPYLDAEHAVTLTANIHYYGTTKEFDHAETIVYQVKPVVNKAQSICLGFGNYFEESDLYKSIAHFPFSPLNRDGSYARGDEATNNIIPLPKKIGDVDLPEDVMKDAREIALDWSCPEEGLLGEDYKLLKQYMRYHEVPLVYKIKYGDDEATGEIKVNVGIAEKPRTLYLGGLMNGRLDHVTFEQDCMSELNLFDEWRFVNPADTSDEIKTWGSIYNWGHGEFGGVTFYADDPDTETRYQYYVSAGSIMVLDDHFSIESNAAGGNATLARNAQNLPTNRFSNYKTNWGLFFMNNGKKAVKIPMAPLSANAAQFTTVDGQESEDPIRWDASIPTAFFQGKDGRDNCFSFDGYRPGFVHGTDLSKNTIDGTEYWFINGINTHISTEEVSGNPRITIGDNGNWLLTKHDTNISSTDMVVTFGNAGGNIQDVQDVNNDHDLTADDYWITIPGYGMGMTFKTQINVPDVIGIFCKPGVEIHYEYYMPYAYSPDNPHEKTEEGFDTRLFKEYSVH